MNIKIDYINFKIEKLDLLTGTRGKKKLSIIEWVKIKETLNQARDDGYTDFREVTSENDRVVMYLASDYEGAPKEIVPVFTNGKVACSFGSTQKKAIEYGIKIAIYYI